MPQRAGRFGPCSAPHLLSSIAKQIAVVPSQVTSSSVAYDLYEDKEVTVPATSGHKGAVELGSLHGTTHKDYRGCLEVSEPL